MILFEADEENTLAEILEIAHKNPAEIRGILTIKILANLLSDLDWRIRYWAYIYLKELKGKGKYCLSLLDKIRAKFLDPHSFLDRK